jgi:cytochrome o ubiquinol oxidase operon protein cyoD
MASPEQAASAKPYWIGYLLALILTGAAFALVLTNALPRAETLYTIAALAVVQTLVHLRFFLHISRKTTSVETMVSLLFALVLITIMIGGSLWIMTNLDARMGM